ncbi:hypothetical protein [Ktedonobacter robiniae]|uniref:Glycosyltransferase RgtA/B/C/D-like domain-containing protein n=1 Tax=Ktedonobacter robiniae TaxID=2778365 RepID=A0ABQ3ULJ8_9CHLR|nr:hypothetical protein [Ktedonobacter robiniae]GHO53604.1 hypothetical protein KSB_20790 [Ktedonobacter robiniae]
MKLLKNRKIGTHELLFVGLLVLAFVIRLGLISQGWPATNSDEGTIGLMGLHIAFNGEHPTFYYGQYYMGPHQAYVAALLFRLFGPSLFMLRFGLLLIFTLFLISTYLLTRLVYSKGWALFCLFFLGTGSSFIMARELSAIGGYTETLLFGSLLFLLAGWLVISYRPYQRLRECRWRIVVYLAWGIIAGTSLWDDLLSAPFVLMAGLLLVVFCWRELLQLITPLAALIGLLVGAFPMLYYNLHAAPGEDSLSVLNNLRGNGIMTTQVKILAVKHAIDISVPMMTGEPFCQANELAALGPTTSYARGCTLIREAWGYSYMLLLGIAILLALWGLWGAWREWRGNRQVELEAAALESTHWLRRQVIHLALLISAVITFYLYAFSSAPIDWPGIHARYLIGFLVATPAIFWPLWQGFISVQARLRTLVQVRRVVCGALLALVGALLVVGSVDAYTEAPAISANNARDMALINTLLSHRVSHIYSDYWTCNKIMFLSNERVICAVVNDQLQDSHNRYHRYYDVVSADPKAAYVFPIDIGYVKKDGDQYTLPIVDEYAPRRGFTYQIIAINGYVLDLTQ